LQTCERRDRYGTIGVRSGLAHEIVHASAEKATTRVALCPDGRMDWVRTSEGGPTGYSPLLWEPNTNLGIE